MASRIHRKAEAALRAYDPKVTACFRLRQAAANGRACIACRNYRTEDAAHNI